MREFGNISEFPKGYSLSGVLFNLGMIPLLSKIKDLPQENLTKPYITSAYGRLYGEGIISQNYCSHDMLTILYWYQPMERILLCDKVEYFLYNIINLLYETKYS